MNKKEKKDSETEKKEPFYGGYDPKDTDVDYPFEPKETEKKEVMLTSNDQFTDEEMDKIKEEINSKNKEIVYNKWGGKLISKDSDGEKEIVHDPQYTNALKEAMESKSVPYIPLKKLGKIEPKSWYGIKDVDIWKSEKELTEASGDKRFQCSKCGKWFACYYVDGGVVATICLDCHVIHNTMGGEKSGLCAFPNCDEMGILRANGKMKCEQHYYTIDSKPPELCKDGKHEYSRTGVNPPYCVKCGIKEIEPYNHKNCKKFVNFPKHATPIDCLNNLCSKECFIQKDEPREDDKSYSQIWFEIGYKKAAEDVLKDSKKEEAIQYLIEIILKGDIVIPTEDIEKIHKIKEKYELKNSETEKKEVGDRICKKCGKQKKKAKLFRYTRGWYCNCE